ncbi:hypothetical protein Hypma_005520 [Hypsizygus marmoreus]|uniref:Uncharacterized protein n=1 Tax=Hypsizygus marmoreus TaxID=39966 RepID=A0A369K4D7_HYPMA|nr:hypothetical protein Hypma_005520 [Hypsizygus marmoreus]
MHTLRAQGVTIDDFCKRANEWSEEQSKEDVMTKGDPAGVLVRIGQGSETTVCLAVVGVAGFSIPGIRGLATQAPLDQLEVQGKQCPSVVAQILRFIPNDSSESGNVLGWRWTGEYVRAASDTGDTSVSTHKQYQFTIPGHLVHPLTVSAIPAVPSDTIQASKLSFTWRIAHEDLTDTCEYAWSLLAPDPNENKDEIITNLDSLPTIPSSSITWSNLPYHHHNEACFVVNSDEIPSQVLVTKKKSNDDIPCKLCGLKTKLSEMRMHVGRHILLRLRQWEDLDNAAISESNNTGLNPCGWCGKDDTDCWSRLVADPKSQKQPQVESNCEYHYTSMRYSSAAKFSKTSPCTNVLIHCPLCISQSGGSEGRTFWRYNAMYHLISEHAEFEGRGKGASLVMPKVPVEFIIETFITRAEEASMGVDPDATLQYRRIYDIPMSDELELVALARKRALSNVTSDEHVSKHR